MQPKHQQGKAYDGESVAHVSFQSGEYYHMSVYCPERKSGTVSLVQCLPSKHRSTGYMPYLKERMGSKISGPGPIKSKSQVQRGRRERRSSSRV